MKKKLVVLTGAGMSAESGIATFRDSGGLWEEYPVEKVATPEGVAANPELVQELSTSRRSTSKSSSTRCTKRLDRSYNAAVRRCTSAATTTRS